MNRSKHSIGTLVFIDGLPHNVISYVTKNGSLKSVSVRSWAGNVVSLSAYKFRKLVSV